MNPFQPFIGNILRDDAALVVHQLRDERRFAAGSGAEIQNRFAGLRSQHAHGEQRAGVLDVKPAVAKTRQRIQRRMRFQFKDQVFLEPVAPDEIVFHVFVTPAGEQVAGIFEFGGAGYTSPQFYSGSLGLV